MLGFLAKRLLTTAGMIFFVVSVVFLALYLVPGDPAEVLLASKGGAPTPEVVAVAHTKLGLDRPVFAQYESYLGPLLRADLGTSFADDEPVFDDINGRAHRR